MKKYIYLIFIFISACKAPIHLSKVEPQNKGIDSTLVSDETYTQIISPYKQRLDSEMNEVVAKCEKILVKEQPEGSLGNLMADILYQKATEYYGSRIDFAAMNYGGIRIPSINGTITKGTVYELSPFDNYIVIVEVDAQTTLKFFELMAAKGGWPISQQARFRISKDNKPNNIVINGLAWDETSTYKIAINDYMANGGDNCSFFKPLKKIETGKIFRNAILEYFKAETEAGKAIQPSINGRVLKD